MAKFSIILPVKNGGHYVKECVRSILSQSYKNFDLIVLDNNSTDGTFEWISSINDPRIKLYPSAHSLTIEQNWGRVLDIKKNEFITLIGHDDILKDDYLLTMNDLTLQYPEASLYQTHFTYIGADGRMIRSCRSMDEVESVDEFLRKFLRNEIDVMGTGFMMRAKDYDSLGGIPPYPNLLFADFELWIKLTKKSYKITAARECFSFRIHQSTTTLSPDTKYHDAFRQFVLFLRTIRIEDDKCSQVIIKNIQPFLKFYCRGLSHRLLRTPKSQRNGLTVRSFVFQCKEYAKMLGIAEGFKPEREFSIRLAMLIDSNKYTRNMFLLLKKAYPQPFLK